MHPFIKRYVESNVPVTELLTSENKPLEPTLECMLLLKQSKNNNSLIEIASGKALTLDLKSVDPSLAVLFFLTWIGAEKHYNSNNKEFINYLSRKAIDLFDKDTPPVLKAQCNLSFYPNRNKRICYFKKILNKNTDLPRWSSLYESYILTIAQSGMGKDLEDFFDNSSKNKLLILDEQSLLRYQFLNSIETGDIKKASFLYIKLKKIKITHKLINLQINLFFDILQLFNKQVEVNHMAFPDDLMVQTDYNALQANHYLLEGDLKESLSWARKSHKGLIHTVSGFLSYTLIRAELANNRAEAALRLLNTNRENMTHYLDDFFFARIELLNGNRDKAALHFAKVYKACQYYGAQGRLDFELDLALELSSSDVRFLTEAAMSLSKNKIKEFEKKEQLKHSDKPNANILLNSNKGVERLIGNSVSLIEIKDSIKKYAKFDVPILITGETGVGKEVVSRAIHEESNHKDEPFLAINCGAISEPLLQSELFGHMSGSFTGASKNHMGIFEAAGKGTVFLDEIGAISHKLQIALLRVLEAKEIRPIGSTKAKPYHCRILAATNAVLEKLVDEDLFRMDLLYRLKRLEINLPPLRERPKDILTLAELFLCDGRSDGQIPQLSPELQEVFINHSWPGNIRQLKSEIERMRLMNSEKLYYEAIDCTLLGKEKTNKILEKDRGALPAEPLIPEVKLAVAQSKIDFRPFLSSGKSPFRRLEKLRNFFQEYKSLTRSEASKMLEVSLKTAGLDLKFLCEEDFIIKIKPSASTRTHYFTLAKHSS